MSAEAAKSAFEVIKSKMTSSDSKIKGKGPIVIATVKGDIHDIGKNIVKLLLENYGYEVCDLGRDVSPETVVNKVAELNAPIVALSALMTTTVPAMEETIKLIKEKAPFCKTLVGGAVMNEDYANMIHADGYAPDAMGAVRLVSEYIG
jgi:5-methyltetrahydrofolate--homocysteine methyltransferase